MKELIEGLLFAALLKFLGVPMWLISLGSTLFLIGFFFYMSFQSADSRRRARELAVAVAREKQQAEEIKEAERARQEVIADAEWNARFVGEAPTVCASHCGSAVAGVLLDQRPSAIQPQMRYSLWPTFDESWYSNG